MNSAKTIITLILTILFCLFLGKVYSQLNENYGVGGVEGAKKLGLTWFRDWNDSYKHYPPNDLKKIWTVGLITNRTDGLGTNSGWNLLSFYDDPKINLFATFPFFSKYVVNDLLIPELETLWSNIKDDFEIEWEQAANRVKKTFKIIDMGLFSIKYTIKCSDTKVTLENLPTFTIEMDETLNKINFSVEFDAKWTTYMRGSHESVRATPKFTTTIKINGSIVASSDNVGSYVFINEISGEPTTDTNGMTRFKVNVLNIGDVEFTWSYLDFLLTSNIDKTLKNLLNEKLKNSDFNNNQIADANEIFYIKDIINYYLNNPKGLLLTEKSSLFKQRNSAQPIPSKEEILNKIYEKEAIEIERIIVNEGRKGEYWAIGNKPNWSPLLTPNEYASFYTKYYRKIKELDPGSKIIGGAILMTEAIESPQELAILTIPKIAPFSQKDIENEFKNHLNFYFNKVNSKTWYKEFINDLPNDIQVEIGDIQIYPMKFKSTEINWDELKFLINDLASWIRNTTKFKEVWVTEFGNIDWRSSEKEVAELCRNFCQYFNTNTVGINKWFWYKSTGVDHWFNSNNIKTPITALFTDAYELTDIGKIYLNHADNTPPIMENSPNDEGVYTDTTFVTFKWNKAKEIDTGIIDYHLQVGTSPGKADVFDNWIGQNTTTYSVNGANGQTLYARVRAKNGAGLISTWSDYSDGITIDTTPPTPPGTPTDNGGYTISQNVTFNWLPAMDNTSGICDYNLQIGTTPGSNDLFDQWIGNIHTKRVNGTAGQILYARVQAKNGAGLLSEWSAISDGITLLSVDIVFAFDLSTNMDINLNNMKLAAIKTINDMNSSNVDARYGLVSFIDYPQFYTSDNYSAQYGLENDYPWKIHQNLTDDTTSVKNNIDKLCTYSGADNPQDYTRALLESIFLNWRPSSRKFVVLIGNAPAHDPNFFSTSYGTDPGPDSKIGTWDDLNYETTVDWINQNGITIISLDCGSAVDLTLDYHGDVWKNFDFLAKKTTGTHLLKKDWQHIFLTIKDNSENGYRYNTLYPWVLEAEEMQNRIEWYGSFCEDGWKLTHQDHPIYNSFVSLKDSVYTFTITAKADIAGGAAPWLLVQIGNEFKGTCEINSTEWKNYSFNAPVSSGFHCIQLTYLNDWWNESDDRNLLIDKVTINYLNDQFVDTLYSLEAESMKNQYHKNYLNDDCIVLSQAYSFISHDIYLTRKDLTFIIYAKADSVNGVWPKLNLQLDNIIVSSHEVDDTKIIGLTTKLANIESGKHQIKIAYNPGSYANKRNLYIDKIVISTEGSGLLKSKEESKNEDETFDDIPETFGLSQNYPNPFNPETKIYYELPEVGHVHINIYNIRGELVRELVNEMTAPGKYSIIWDGKGSNYQDLPNGCYFIQMQVGAFKATQKALLVK